MRSEKRFGAQLAVVAMLVAFMSAPAAHAATNVDIEFLWSPESDNSTQIYLHVSNTAWEPSRSQVKKVYPRLRHPEWDYPVLVFMAHESGKSLGAVWKVRKKSKTWAVTMKKLGISRDRLIIELKQRPTPRGKAHGYWKKHSARRAALTDDDIYYWVNIHTHARYFETAPGVVVGLREDGRTFKALAAHSFRGGQGKARKFSDRKVHAAGMGTPAENNPGQKRSNSKRKNNKKN